MTQKDLEFVSSEFDIFATPTNSTHLWCLLSCNKLWMCFGTIN